MQLVETNPDVTVHLESGTDVVVVEGVAQVETDVNAEVLGAYNTKYEWGYTYEEYGPLTRIYPMTILSWRSTGWAGREGIQESGRWRFD